MIKLNEQSFVINIMVAKSLLNKLALCSKDCDCGCKGNASNIDACSKDCDCGCVSNVELCDKDCDCGCKDNTSNIDACSKDCDCGCASNVELCDKDCDCGCKDNASSIDACSKDCDCGCNANIENNTEHCNCKHCQEESASYSNGGDDGDDEDGKKKTQNETINNKQENHNHNECHCGCEHHNGHHHHHHNGQCSHNDEHNHHHQECNCEHEKNLANEYLNLAKQIQADFDNYRKRNAEAISQAKNEGIKSVLLDFLPALDAVDRALNYIVDEQSREGVHLIRKIFEKAFNDYKIEPIRCLGQHYDPNYHDVVYAEESDKPSGTIIEEIETGYIMNGKVIRHSVVKIAK